MLTIPFWNFNRQFSTNLQFLGDNCTCSQQRTRMTMDSSHPTPQGPPWNRKSLHANFAQAFLSRDDKKVSEILNKQWEMCVLYIWRTLIFIVRLWPSLGPLFSHKIGYRNFVCLCERWNIGWNIIHELHIYVSFKDSFGLVHSTLVQLIITS